VNFRYTKRGRAAGLMEGQAAGRMEERMEVAKNLLSDGLSILNSTLF
jgi:hypothetical protein